MKITQEDLDNLELTPQMSEAMDVLSTYLNKPYEELPEKWMLMLYIAEKNGDDPSAVAKKLCELNKVLKK